MIDQLTLIFVNNSSISGNVCLYQQAPTSEALPVAWFTEHVHPTSRTTFSWDQSDIGFVWSQTGKLGPGISCGASQFWKSNLTDNNLVNFTREDEAYTFANQRTGEQPGFLTIQTDNTLIPGQASVGIGMAGAAIFLKQAELNLTYAFAPHPVYWITFGQHTRGEVINVDTVTTPAQIKFPINTPSMTAILNADSTWTVKPSWQVNDAFTAAQKENKNTLFGMHKI